MEQVGGQSGPASGDERGGEGCAAVCWDQGRGEHRTDNSQHH